MATVLAQRIFLNFPCFSCLKKKCDAGWMRLWVLIKFFWSWFYFNQHGRPCKCQKYFLFMQRNKFTLPSQYESCQFWFGWKILLFFCSDLSKGNWISIQRNCRSIFHFNRTLKIWLRFNFWSSTYISVWIMCFVWNGKDNRNPVIFEMEAYKLIFMQNHRISFPFFEICQTNHKWSRKWVRMWN